MIYRRPHSVKTKVGDYIKYFGSTKNAKKRCFNIGSGTWVHKCWTNIDLPAQTKAFKRIQSPCIYHDLVASEDLPIQQSSAEILYCSHVIEHLPESCVEKLFQSAYRVLDKGGVLRIVTGPDADLEFDALLRKDLSWWYFYDGIFFNKNRPAKQKDIFDFWLLHTATPRSVRSRTPCDKKYSNQQIKELIHKHQKSRSKVLDLMTLGLKFNRSYPSDHLSWWNADKIINKLRSAGFKKTARSAYGQSSNFFLRDLSLFDTTYPQISVYVEAQK